MKGSTIIMLMIASVSASRFGLEDEFARTRGHSLTDFQRGSTLCADDRSVHALAVSKYIEKRLIAATRKTLPRLYGSYASDAVDAYAQETQLQARDLKEAAITATLIVMTLLGTGGAGYFIGTAWHEYHKHEPRRLGRNIEAARLVMVDTNAQAKLKARDSPSNPYEHHDGGAQSPGVDDC